MRRVKITKAQYHIWKNPKHLFYVNEQTGEIQPSEYETVKHGNLNGTSTKIGDSFWKVMDCRNAVRAQIKHENDGQDCLILFFNGSVLGSTRPRKPSPVGIGIDAGVPLSPEQCPCKGWNGTTPGKHHSICQHKDNWELMGANHRDRINTVPLVPKYPIVNTKPPEPGKRSTASNSSRFSEPVVNTVQVPAKPVIPSAEERKNNPLFQPVTQRQKELFGEPEDTTLELTDASGNVLQE